MSKKRNPANESTHPVVHAEPPPPSTRCPKCRSDKRTPYHNTTTRVIGQCRITWRRTCCENCGQHRIDRMVERLTKAELAPAIPHGGEQPVDTGAAVGVEAAHKDDAITHAS